MQRFAVILFALVAVFAIIVPSSAKALSQVKRETNADRFARGLPPLAPSRRSTAKRTQHSQTSVSRSGRIQVRDHGNGGQSFGYLQNGPSGPGGINPGNDDDYTDLFAQYNPAEKSIFCLGSQFSQGGSYLGALINTLSGSTNYVPITNVDIGDTIYEAAIWTIELSGKLTALYSNPDGSTVVINFAYNTVTNIIVLVDNVGDLCSQNSGWKQVDIYMV